MTTALTHYDIAAPTIGDRFSAKVIQAAADIQLTCRLLANYGAGFDHIDVSAANAAGIQVTNTPGATTIATAETTMILLLMAARRITEGQAAIRPVRLARLGANAIGWHGPSWKNPWHCWHGRNWQGGRA